MTNETSTVIAKALDLKKTELQKESLKVFLERELLAKKTELFSLAVKYNLKNIKSFVEAARRGKIQESSETREDFFRWDYLEKRISMLGKLLKSL